MHNLERFVSAQAGVYEQALTELRAGAKRSHWMWFVFPQVTGLGVTETSRFYAISGLDEARAYLVHVLLGPRLAECTDAVLAWRGKRSASEIFGPVDTLKFASCMTLFEVAGGGTRYGEALDAFCGGERDRQSLALLAAHS